MNAELTSVEIQPTSMHLYSVIWLHGLGADGHDFESLVPELHLAAKANTHFVFPNAPIQPVTVNGGMKMRSWYDIVELNMKGKIDYDGINESSALLGRLIEQEVAKGIPTEHILLAGFSQGGVVALHTGLRYPKRLAGIVGLSTYLPTLAQIQTEKSSANADLPIFMAHGILDAVIAIEIAKVASDGLKALNYHVEWHDYLMEHSLCVEEIHHLSTFINSIFKPA